MISGIVTGGGICASLIANGNTNYGIVIGTGMATVFGSLLPDIDSRTSKLGKKFRITSKIVSKLFGHRGFLHSPLFIILLFLLINGILSKNGINQTFYYLNYGLAFGCLNHLFCDMLTKGGIPLFYPFQKIKFSILPMKSGSKYEIVPLILTCILQVVIAFIFVSKNIFIK